MYKLIIQPEAITDIEDSFEWYESQKAGLGHEFKEELEKAFTHLQTAPLYYSSVTENLRRYRIKRFPYLIIFGIEKKKIIVIGIRHMRRKPNY